jgi:hypothetical protein
MNFSLKSLVLNVRVYRCIFQSLPYYSSKLSADDIQTLFGQVNHLWQAGGISWRLRSLISFNVDDNLLAGFHQDSRRIDYRKALVTMSPRIPEIVGDRLWKVCIMKNFPIRSNGVYLPDTRTVFCAEVSRRGELNAAVLAHELGHSLGLVHMDRKGNLMNPNELKKIHRKLVVAKDSNDMKNTGVISNDQVDNARTQAMIGPYKI